MACLCLNYRYELFHSPFPAWPSPMTYPLTFASESLE